MLTSSAFSCGPVKDQFYGFLDPLACDHRLRGFEGPAADEDREPGEQGLLRVAQQVPTPVDEGAQGLLAGQRGVGAAREQPEAIVEALGYRFDFVLRGRNATPTEA